MSRQELQIRFPEDPVKVAVKEIDEKLDRFFVTLFSVGVVFVTTLIVMFITLLVDSFHVNSATYKEYSDKTESVDQALKTNGELLDQNKKNQELILTLQKQISDLVNKLPQATSDNK